MFFGPLIYTVANFSDSSIYLLCLSMGNYENLAIKRREELWNSCRVLGIPSANIILIDSTHLPDNPLAEWRADTLAKLILHTVETLDIDVLISFDRDGVSQHLNHCAIYYAVASLCLTNSLPKECKLYVLDSVNIIRKYISVFDIICTCLMSKYWCILSLNHTSVIRKAMQQYASQMRWFRWLYIYFSRFIFINSFSQINADDVALESQIYDDWSS